MDIFKQILEQFGAFFQLQEQLKSLATTNPIVAGIIIFIISIVVANLVITQIIELKKRFFGKQRNSALAWSGLILGGCLAGLISASTVLNLRQTSAAMPEFDKDLDIVVGRPLVLKWSYSKRNARFEIQSSADPDFLDSVDTNTADGTYFPTQNTNGKRFWRVREIDASDQPASPWSRSIPIVQYETTLKRIQTTRSLSVYTSSSFNEGFFKFYAKKDGKQTRSGYDIAILEEVVKKLPPLLGIDGPLKYDLTQVKWEDLLATPQSGRADIIISTITSFPAREEEFGIKFSEPYYCTTQSLVYRPPVSAKSVREMIENRKVGVQGRTTSQKIMKQFRKEIPDDRKFDLKEDFDQPGSMVDALMNRTIDVGMTDTPFARAAQWQNDADRIVFDKGRRLSEGNRSGGALRKVRNRSSRWRNQARGCDQHDLEWHARRKTGAAS
jgi:ABC-type amino acid transport substrate-binding protein